jgi:D-erythro-7,8-dihydroneopterin triphosphate epimerase
MASAKAGQGRARRGPLEKIHIRDLLVRCVVGVNEEERAKRQDVVLNLVLHADLAEASRSDCIADTVNYKTIRQEIMAAVEPASYRLIERLAAHVAEICLKDPRVQRVEVTADKPGALRFARSVAVELVRERGAEKRPRRAPLRKRSARA